MTIDANKFDAKVVKLCQSFGFRLERLFEVGKRKFHPTLLSALKTRDLCGIFVWTEKSKSEVTRILHYLGWEKSAKIQFMEYFPKKNYFDAMTLFDVTVCRKGNFPTMVDIYFLDSKELSLAKRKGFVTDEVRTFVLGGRIQTFIRHINPFNHYEGQAVVGIGGKLHGFPSWYVSLETTANVTLFDQSDQPILSSISQFFASIGCYIPGCTSIIDEGVRYWHRHIDPDHRLATARNIDQADTHISISFGSGFRVEITLANGRQRRILIPIDVYQFMFEPILTSRSDNDVTIPEHFIYLSQTLGSKVYPVLDANITSANILHREPLLTLESRDNVFKVFNESLMLNERPALVLISEKGSFKSTFIKFCEENNAKMVFIDSDDFGCKITTEFLKLHQEEIIYSDPNENFIINWFRYKLLEFEIPISELSGEVLGRMSKFRILIDEFSTFWKDVYDKGLGDVPSFNDYVSARVNATSNALMVVILTHNVFEARLCHSKSILTIRSGVDTDEILNRRAYHKTKTVAQYIADLLYQQFCLSNQYLHQNVVGWGDIISLSRALGVM